MMTDTRLIIHSHVHIDWNPDCIMLRDWGGLKAGQTVMHLGELDEKRLYAFRSEDGAICRLFLYDGWCDDTITTMKDR